MKKFIVLFGLSFIPFFGYTQQAPTLQELVDSAMEYDQTLQQQVLENKITHLNNEKLKDIFLPKIEVSGKTGYLYSGIHFTMPDIHIPSLLNVIPVRTIAGNDNRLDISGISAMARAETSMLIYSGGKVKHLKKANEEKDLSEKVLMEKSRDEVITTISKAYDQFALICQSKLSLEEAKKRLDLNRKTADKALGYGLITPYEHKKIELAQATLDSKIVEYEGKKNLLITQLHLLTGVEKERIEQIEPQLLPIEYQVSEDNIDNRAEIKALEHGIKATEFKIKAEEQWWIPKVQAMASFTYIGLYNNHLKTADPLVSNTKFRIDLKPANLNILPLFQVGIGFKWEVMDGNEGKHAVEIAKIEKEILESKKNNAKRLLKLNLVNNQANYDVASALIKLKIKAKEIARKALDNVEKEFRYGTKKSLDLIEAENDLQTAELDYQTAIFNQRRSAIELMKSTQDLHVERL